MAKKLTYFSVNGLGEAIRYILHYNREEFQDVWVDLSEWPINSIKDALPYGQLPLYEEGDRKLNQSIAIARYVGHRAKLVPEDPWEQAQLDAAVMNMYDFIMKLRPCFTEPDPEKRDAMLKEYLEVTMVYYLTRFERELKEKKGYFGEKLSWADFYLLGTIETINSYLDAKIESNFQTITALTEEIRNLPGVKKYIATRRPYNINY